MFKITLIILLHWLSRLSELALSLTANDELGIYFSLLQLLSLTNVPMVMFVLLEGLVIIRVMFRYVSMEHGDMSVIIVGA